MAKCVAFDMVWLKAYWNSTYPNLKTWKVILLNQIIVEEKWQYNVIIRKEEYKISIKIIANTHYYLMKFIFFKINIKQRSNSRIFKKSLRWTAYKLTI